MAKHWDRPENSQLPQLPDTPRYAAVWAGAYLKYVRTSDDLKYGITPKVARAEADRMLNELLDCIYEERKQVGASRDQERSGE